ncbi:MAG: O-antigen ligase family protein [Rhizobiaceae bacterium]
MTAFPHELPRAAVNAKAIALITGAAVGLGVFLSGFVINEPAPYELFMTALIAVWAFAGLRLSRFVMPLLILLVVFNIGGVLSMSFMDDMARSPVYPPLYIAVSLFLAFTAVFIAAAVEVRPALYSVMFRAWIVSACLTSFLGIAGYFHAFPGADIFTRYDRAAGAFEDPNVFGPFLVLPGIYLLQRIILDPVRMLLYSVPLLLILGGLFLSFSRGAWGLYLASAVLLVGCLFLQSSSGRFRLRVAVMTIAAVTLLVLALLIALQIPAISDLFTTRAQLVQDYDGARLGRFARYGIGFGMAAENPFGIGPLMFGQLLGEDTHNIWLKALMDYGWLGFACWLTMVLWTIVGGFRILFRDRPWQPYLLCAYVVFVGHVFLGTFIDTDHWRHFYLLIGMVWGAMGLEYRHQIAAAGRSAKSIVTGRPISVDRLPARQ